MPAQPLRAAEAAASSLLAAVELHSPDAVNLIRQHLVPAVAHFSDYIADHGKGSYIWTTDGQKHLDMGAGIGVVSTGHSHPKVVKAIQDQAARIIHPQQNIFPAHPPMAALLDRLLKICPSQLTRFFFANSGSEAIDNAMKIARAHTGKQNIICFENSFHGRTYGAMAITTSKTYYRQGFAPLVPSVTVAPYPYCLHCKARACAPDGDDWYKVAPNIPPYEPYSARRCCDGPLEAMVAPNTPPYQPYSARRCCNGPLEAMEWVLKQQTAPSETAAVIVEPILGEGGFLTPPPSFLPGLRKLCDKHGLLLILDEVQSGVARTGKWWGHQHMLGEDEQPDIMTFAKGIAAGFPFAGLAMKDHVKENLVPGTLGGTYGGGPLACAAAVATLDVIEGEGLLQNAEARGRQLVAGLLELANRFPIIDVRGRGLMVAAEFGAPDGGLKAPYGLAAKVTKACGKRNMILLSAGARETVRFLPPLTVNEAEIDTALGILSEALEEVFGKG
ncbi:hypothetical protein WJX81_008310 [Elliptochloris bilobata]|uniref:4-aminobutyrate aminotransferase n=1 Tax=Elliptochloris bilobata TaxID=381761 RepID=A0AAW1RHK0_9CHLO